MSATSGTSSPSERDAQQGALSLRRDAERLGAGLPDLVIEAERLAASVHYGAHGRRQAGAGETFWEFRHYRAGDPLQRLDWRRSARGDELFIRERELETAETLYLWCDVSVSMDYASDTKTLPTKARRAMVMAAAAAVLACRAGERVRVLASQRPTLSGRAGAQAAVNALAEGIDIEQALADPAALRGRGRFLFVSDFLEPAEVWDERFSLLSGAGARAVLGVVADPAEETFPFRGRTQFEPLSSGLTPLLFGRAELAKRAYQDRYQAHFGALNDGARKLGWPMVTSRTDAPASQGLLAIMAALAPMRR